MGLGVRRHHSLLTFLPVLSDKGNVHLSKRQLVVSLVFSIVFLVFISFISTLFFLISLYPLTFTSLGVWFWGAGEGLVVVFWCFLVAVDPCGKKLV